MRIQWSVGILLLFSVNVHIFILDVNCESIALGRIQKYVVNDGLFDCMDVLAYYFVDHDLNGLWFLVLGIDFVENPGHDTLFELANVLLLNHTKQFHVFSIARHSLFEFLFILCCFYLLYH